MSPELFAYYIGSLIPSLGLSWLAVIGFAGKGPYAMQRFLVGSVGLILLASVSLLVLDSAIQAVGFLAGAILALPVVMIRRDSTTRPKEPLKLDQSLASQATTARGVQRSRLG